MLWIDAETMPSRQCPSIPRLYATLVDGRYGFSDATGQIVIQPAFHRAHERFYEGLAGVGTPRGFGYIDEFGSLVIPPHFMDGGSFSEGLAAVCVEGKWGYIDKQGKVAIPPEYDEAGPFENGVAVVGIAAGSLRNEMRSRFVDAELDMIRYVIDKNGARRATNLDRLSKPFVVYTVRYSNGTCDVFDSLNNRVTTSSFEAIRTFSEGLAPVKRDGRFGYINTSGEMVIPCIYDFAGHFSAGVARVGRGGSFSWIRTDGSELTVAQPINGGG